MFKYLISKPIKKNQTYQERLECILSGQVSSNTIAFYFKNKKFYQWYIKNKRI